MVELRIGEPDVSLAVEADAMELHLQRIVAAARGVEHHAGGLVHHGGHRFRAAEMSTMSTDSPSGMSDRVA